MLGARGRHARQSLRGRRWAAVLVGAATLTAAASFGTAWADSSPLPAPSSSLAVPAPAAGPDLGAVADGSVHPGVQVRTAGAQCTANFVFTGGGKTYLGQAAHCSGTGTAEETDGCSAKSLPLGTPVEISGASKPGRLAYNSWIAMQNAHERNPDACAYNDLALIEIDPADVAKVSSSVPFFGGPVGVDAAGTTPGERVVSYGNSELRGGVSVLSPKVGTSLGDQGHGWSHTVATVTPGIPGDSGSAFLTADGRALGVLSTLNFTPVPGTNSIGDLAKMLAYAQAHGAPGNLAVAAGGPFRSLGLV
jgi:hypothetical protein